MTEQIHNLYITSANKNANEKNYNYNLYFSNYGIKINPDEEAFLNITSFQSLNTFYNINSLSCNFVVKVYNTTTQTNFQYNITIDDGNYDIYNFMTTVNQLCLNFFTMTYDEKKNKYKYTSNQSATQIIYIKPSIYNYKYFGLTQDTFTIIPNGSTLLSNIINLNNFSLIVIKVIGLVEQNKTLDNFNTNISRGDICGLVNRQDTAVNALINWCDLNKAFQKKISNTEINYLNFVFTDEYNNILFDLNDWLITLTITIKKKS